MRAIRIYHPTPLRSGDSIVLSEIAAHHVRAVLRLGAGTIVQLFHPTSGEYRAELTQVQKKSVTALVGENCSTDRESPLFLHLAQGISRSQKMDMALQKSVELGVQHITPIITEFSQVPAKTIALKHHHWQGIIIHAAEQCGRTQLPQLDAPIRLPDFLQTTSADFPCLLSTQTAPRLSQYAVNLAPQSAILLIGPEGGFSDEEMEQALASGYHAVSLGPRILRTETAAITAISILQARWGDG